MDVKVPGWALGSGAARWGMTTQAVRLFVECCRMCQTPPNVGMGEPFRLTHGSIGYRVSGNTFCRARKELLQAGWLRREHRTDGRPLRNWYSLRRDAQ